jgi:hypothetical protein
MMAVVRERPKLKRLAAQFQQIRSLAESCARQLTAWTTSLEDSPVQGKRHLTAPVRAARQTAQAAKQFRQNFLKSLKPEHPLYQSAEARAARGEAVEE